jgi:NADH-quinone oxidoreductase subunit J
MRRGRATNHSQLKKEHKVELAFYISAVVAVAATIMVITRRNAVHAVLYLIVSLLALGIAFFVLGAPFAAALEVIIYAGAIMVLFVFVIMILNAGEAALQQENQWLKPRTWAGPVLLSVILLAELIFLLNTPITQSVVTVPVSSKAVGILLFGPYLLAVEIASMLLLAGLIGAYHLGRQFFTQHHLPPSSYNPVKLNQEP